MSILDLFRDNPQERIDYVSEIASLEEDVGYLRADLREAKEDLLRISDAFDGIGWSPLPEDEAAEIPLKTVKKVAHIARALNAMNPFVKRGVNARISYVWGKGVTFDGIDSIDDKIELHYSTLFTPQAFEELERVLATDGNAFTAFPIMTDERQDVEAAFRIKLDDITGAVSNPKNKEEIWFYKREYTVKKTNSRTGLESEDKFEKYYASMEYWQKQKKLGKNLPRNWNAVGVEQDYVILHTTVNKQVGWRWGVPDILPVIFWAKAYKEYLEDNATLVKAYSRLAWNYKPDSLANASSAASVLQTPPSRDPITGELRNIGGTSMAMGGALTPVPATGSSVDFSKGSPLASAIAAGLEVSLVVITSDPGSGNRATAETLDLPTLKAMESRQALHTERFLKIFQFWGVSIRPKAQNANKEISEAVAENDGPTGSGIDYAVVTWPQIETDTTKDRITALGTGVELGILYKQEARKEALDVLQLAPYRPWDDLPTMDDDPAAKEQMQVEQDMQQAQFDNEAKIAKQGVSGGISAKGGSQSTNNQARTARKKDTNNS